MPLVYFVAGAADYTTYTPTTNTKPMFTTRMENVSREYEEPPCEYISYVWCAGISSSKKEVFKFMVIF